MIPSDPAHRANVDYMQEIDGALAVLGAIQPRAGLEQRVLARIAAAPALPWYRRLSIAPAGHHQWALAAACAVIVAGGTTMTTHRYRPQAAPVPLAIHTSRPGATAAASVGVNKHPLQMNKATTPHRGVHRSYRAMHEHVPLPRGTAAPMRPQIVPAPQ